MACIPNSGSEPATSSATSGGDLRKNLPFDITLIRNGNIAVPRQTEKEKTSEPVWPFFKGPKTTITNTNSMNSVHSPQNNQEIQEKIDQDVATESTYKSSVDNASGTTEDKLQAKRSTCTFTSRDISDLSNVNVNSELLKTPEYLNRVQYAFKLGFTEGQLKIALSELGTVTPKDDDLLRGLIKLGKIGKSIDEETDSEDEEDDVFDDGATYVQPKVMEKKDDESNLRPIVIDGSNVAMSHGNKETFSCLGIRLAVDFFRNRGHKDITVFVPQWRKETPRADSPILNQEVLFELEKEKRLVYTPSRRVGGKRVVCYDDRYILQLAAAENGIVVSNDNYRDLINEHPAFKPVIEERLLMYSFVNDRFMPPSDPLGRHGPTLDNFLLKEPTLPKSLPPICPYLKKCTYGNKCKYYHPERGNKPQRLITEKLAEEAQQKMIEVKERQLSELNEGGQDGTTRLKSTKDDDTPSVEDKEKQKQRQNEQLDHYRKRVEESERLAALMRQQSVDSLDSGSIPVVFPPSHSGAHLSDGTHLSVAKALSDPVAALNQRPVMSVGRRRKSVPSEQAEEDVTSLRKQFSRQMSLQLRPERLNVSSRSSYPAVSNSIRVNNSPPHSTPAKEPVQTFPPNRSNMAYHQHASISEYPHLYSQHDCSYPGYRTMASQPQIHPASLTYPNAFVNQQASKNYQPTYPPLAPVRYGGYFPMMQQHVANLPQRWVPSTGYEGQMYPELPDQSVTGVSYVTGPPVENAVDNEYEVPQDFRYEGQRVEDPYGGVAPSNSSAQEIPAPCQQSDPQRYAIYVNLSNIYGEEVVRRVMYQLPNERRAHIIATQAAKYSVRALP